MTAEHGVELWTRVLDAYAESLDRSVAALEATATIGGEPPPRFTPPGTLPPLPASLRPRAAALADRTDELMARVSSAAEAIRPARATTRHRRVRSHGTAATLDLRG